VTDKTRKKITVNLLNFIDDQLAGAGVFTRNLFLVSLPQLLEEFDIECYASTADVAKIFHLPAHPRLTVIVKRSCSAILRRIFFEQFVLPFKLSRTDIYFCPTPVLPFFVRVINPKCRTVITIHDMIPFLVPNKYGRVRGFYVKWLSKLGAKFAHHVITVSENSKTDICDIADVSPNKITVVYNFIPGSSPPAHGQHANYFLSISTIEPGKNIEGTLRAFHNARKKESMKDFRFYWIGKLGWGYTLQEVEALISSYGLADHFFLTGFVSTEKKAEMMRDCTAMVYLSHYEGFGLPVLEALFHHKPAVVSNTSSLPEVLGKAGVVCSLTDEEGIALALEEIVLNRSRYIQQIPEQLRKFDAAVQGNKFCALIKQQSQLIV
jgi:glycosyltransferase involved in cell wall biosynthesis